MTIETTTRMRLWNPNLRRLEGVPFLGLLLLLGLIGVGGARTLGAAGVPLIYCTDLFHPHEDPDDHFDLATVYALPGFDLRGIVLDQGDRQASRPGRIPVSQLNHLTGRQVPAWVGLGAKLSSAADPALDQPTEWQRGVRFILDTLRESVTPVAIIAVGSLRDVAAAFNREPDLFRRQAGPLLVFIGEASQADFQEYNVGLDPHAYAAILRSGLDVHWVPCFDGGPWQNRGHASYWTAKQADLLGQAAPELQQFFIYALQHEKSDPLRFLREPVDSVRREAVLGLTRNLWCTAIFGTLAGERVDRAGEHYRSHTVGPDSRVSSAPPGTLFGFEDVWVTVTDEGVVKLGEAPGAVRIRRFVVRDPEHYAVGMTQATAELLARFPLRRD